MFLYSVARTITLSSHRQVSLWRIPMSITPWMLPLPLLLLPLPPLLLLLLTTALNKLLYPERKCHNNNSNYNNNKHSHTHTHLQAPTITTTRTTLKLAEGQEHPLIGSAINVNSNVIINQLSSIDQSPFINRHHLIARTHAPEWSSNSTLTLNNKLIILYNL